MAVGDSGAVEPAVGEAPGRVVAGLAVVAALERAASSELVGALAGA